MISLIKQHIKGRLVAGIGTAMVLAIAAVAQAEPANTKPAANDPVVAANAQAGADLAWPDRRPMGRIFLSRVNSGWPTNPRGYLNTPKVDITTEAGLEQFGRDLLAYADRCIAILKDRNCQGVIVWDIEGQEMPHAISYIGDPRVLPEIAPEMDRFADVFFKRFTDAGIRVGITIRPTFAQLQPDKHWRWQQVKVKDAVGEMADKIAYAKERWSCTIFYMDSNVGRQVEGDVPWILPTDWMADLAGRHPDVLIIPEWEAAGYYQYMAPYKDWWDGNQTPPAVRKRKPDAFSFIVPKPHEVATHWDDIVATVAAGDVLFIDAWYTSLPNELVSHVYAAAALHKAGTPAAVRDAQGDALVELVRSSDDHATRLAAMQRLIGQPQASVALWQDGLASDHWQIRRAAVQGLGRSASAEAAALLAPLLSDRGPLQAFVVVALGQLGSDSVPTLKQQVKQGPVAVIDALSANESPQALAVLRDVVANKADASPNMLVRALRGMQGRVDDAVVDAAGPHVLHKNAQVAANAVDILSEQATPTSRQWLERAAAAEANSHAKRKAANYLEKPAFKKLADQ